MQVIDESALPNNEVLLQAYVRFLQEGEIIDNIHFTRNLIADTKGKSIFKIVKEYFKEMNIPLDIIMPVATDEVTAMMGCHSEFIALLNKEVPGILCIHSVIHRQNLVAKNLSKLLHQSLQYINSAEKKISSNSLKDQLFRLLCADNDEKFNHLLLHTEVPWLSYILTPVSIHSAMFSILCLKSSKRKM